MKKINFYLLLNLTWGLLVCSLIPFSYSYAEQDKTHEKFDIMESDENEDTDALTIPSEESEVDDEEESEEFETEEDSDD